jgi:hypothetical protein
MVAAEHGVGQGSGMLGPVQGTGEGLHKGTGGTLVVGRAGPPGYPCTGYPVHADTVVPGMVQVAAERQQGSRTAVACQSNRVTGQQQGSRARLQKGGGREAVK